MNDENRHIFQVYFQDDDSRPIPDKIKLCINSINENKSVNEHLLFNKEQVRDFISTCFDKEVLNTFDKLKPYTYKADLARYCLTYMFGGWYFDATLRANQPIPAAKDLDYVVFKDAPLSGGNSWSVQAGLYFAKRDSAFLETAIRMVVRHAAETSYTNNPINVTGPGVLGAAIAHYHAAAHGVTGNFLPLTPFHKKKNYAFVLPDGDIFAWGKETAGSELTGLASYQADGVNNYSQMWAERDVYDTGITVQMPDRILGSPPEAAGQ